MTAPRYRAWTKAVDNEAGPPRYSAHWVLARRAWLECYADRIECGDWIIPADTVKEAVLYEARQWLVPVYVLAVSTPTRTWQFGFNPWTKVGAHLPFSFRRERVKLTYSTYSIVIRVVFLAVLAYWIWEQLAG